MGHLRKSDRESPDVMVRLRARLAERWSVAELHVDDRYDHWEDAERAVPPVETVASFTVKLGDFVSATIESAYRWPDGRPERVEITVWLDGTKATQWFAIVDGSIRQALESGGFTFSGQWNAAWPADPSCIDGIARQIAVLDSTHLRILRQADLPSGVQWPSTVTGAWITAADEILIGTTKTMRGADHVYSVVLRTGEREMSLLVDEGGMSFIRWWKAADHARVGIAAYGTGIARSK